MDKVNNMLNVLRLNTNEDDVFDEQDQFRTHKFLKFKMYLKQTNLDQLQNLNRLILMPQIDKKDDNGFQIIVDRTIKNKVKTINLQLASDRKFNDQRLCTYIASAQNEIIKLRSEIEVESLPRIVTAFKDSFANSLGGADDRILLVQTFGTSMQTISDSKAGVKGYFSLDSANMIKYEKRLLSDIE